MSTPIRRPTAGGFSSLLALSLSLALAACEDGATAGPEAGSALSGEVLLEGRTPVPGTSLRLTLGSIAHETTSDAAGRFDVTGLAAGDWSLAVTPPAGLALTDDAEVRTIALDGRTAESVQVELASADDVGTLVVEVQVDSTNPGVDVPVMVFLPDGGADTLRTGEAGTVILSVPPGRYVLGLNVPPGLWLVPGTPDLVEVDVTGGATTWHAFPLQSTPPGGETEPGFADVVGSVFVNGTAPLAGVAVDLRAGQLEHGAVSDTLGRLYYGPVAEGFWEIHIEVPDGYALAAGQANPAIQFIPGHGGSATFTVELGADDGSGVLEVLVVADSVPQADVTVWVSQGDGEPLSMGNTGDDGRHRFALQPGTYSAHASPPEGLTTPDGGPARADGLIVSAGQTTHAGFYLVPE